MGAVASKCRQYINYMKKKMLHRKKKKEDSWKKRTPKRTPYEHHIGGSGNAFSYRHRFVPSPLGDA